MIVSSKMDRSGIRGAGEKSDKANLVVMLKRERIDEGYSNEVEVLVDKNTMGGLGTRKQMMEPEFFRVNDIQQPKLANRANSRRVRAWTKTSGKN